MSNDADQDLSPKIVGAVANAVSILRSLARMSEPAGVVAIARDTGVSASTCFNILRTLVGERLVDFDAKTKTYRIGLGVLEFSVPLLGANQANLIRPELLRLSGEHRNLICLWHVTEGDRLVLIDRVSTARTVRVDVPHGSRLPIYVGAIGRCYAAAQGLSEQELRQRFEPSQWQIPPSLDAYVADVQRAKEDGFALDFGQLFIGLDIAAAIITDRTGKPRLGISGVSIAGQLPRHEMERLAVNLRDSADWISEVLFGASRGSRQSERRRAAEQATTKPERSR